MKPKYRYKGTFNWYGFPYKLHTISTSEENAFNNFINKLTKIVNYNHRHVMSYFIYQTKDNYYIERREKLF